MVSPLLHKTYMIYFQGSLYLWSIFSKNYEAVPNIFFTNKLLFRLIKGITKTYYWLNFILTISKMEFSYFSIWYNVKFYTDFTKKNDIGTSEFWFSFGKDLCEASWKCDQISLKIVNERIWAF